jgi:hypothetical protein
VDAASELPGEEVALALEVGTDGQLEVELAHTGGRVAVGKSLAPSVLRRPAFYCLGPLSSPMRWADLFAEAEEYEVTVGDIETELAERRGDG